jgi:hypothetical protein
LTISITSAKDGGTIPDYPFETTSLLCQLQLSVAEAVLLPSAKQCHSVIPSAEKAHLLYVPADGSNHHALQTTLSIPCLGPAAKFIALAWDLPGRNGTRVWLVVIKRPIGIERFSSDLLHWDLPTCEWLLRNLTIYARKKKLELFTTLLLFGIGLLPQASV